MPNLHEHHAPAAATLEDMYTVPVGKEVVITNVNVCNRSPTPTAFRVSTAEVGAADAVEQYLWYDVPIPGVDTFNACIGVTLNAGDVVRVYATLATLSFSIYGIVRDPL